MIVSVFRTISGSELFVSIYSRMRAYDPGITLSGLMVTMAFPVSTAEVLSIDTHDRSEPDFYLRLIARVSPVTSVCQTYFKPYFLGHIPVTLIKVSLLSV